MYKQPEPRNNILIHKIYIMKKQTLWLLLIGSVCMSFSLLASPFIKVPDSITDFLKGMGVAFIIAALFVQKKLQRIRK
jgi:hypothetical protein